MRFVLPIPPSTNNLYRNAGKRRIKTERYKGWIAEAGKDLLPQKKGQRLPDPPYELHVWLRFGDLQARDADNYNKAVQDLLATMLGFNDKLVTDPCQHKRYEKGEPVCIAILTTYTGPEWPE